MKRICLLVIILLVVPVSAPWAGGRDYTGPASTQAERDSRILAAMDSGYDIGSDAFYRVYNMVNPPDTAHFYAVVDTVLVPGKQVGESKLTWEPQYAYDNWGTALVLTDHGQPMDCPCGTLAKVSNPGSVNADMRGSRWYGCFEVDIKYDTTWLPKVPVYLTPDEVERLREFLRKDGELTND